MKIKNTMKAPENYACFSLDNGKVVALDRDWTVCTDVIIRSPSSDSQKITLLH